MRTAYGMFISYSKAVSRSVGGNTTIICVSNEVDSFKLRCWILGGPQIMLVGNL